MELKSKFFFFVSITILFIAHGAEYDYQFRFATSISPAQMKDPNTTTTLAPSADTKLHICELKEEDKIQICKEALQQELIVDSSIKLVENTSVLPMQFYDVVVSVYTTSPPVTIAACICPTSPPIYLKDESSGKEVYAYVCQEDSYADVMDRINNPDGGDNDTTTEY